MDSTRNVALDYRPIGDLIPYARNARTHSEAQVALIAGSIREYGFTNPVLVDGENGIIAGRGRVMAARKLGLAQVPVIELAHLTEAQKRAYILADDKLVEQAGWDEALLVLELGDLQDMAVDLTSLGFDAAELDALLRAGEADERKYDIPPVPATPASQAGDLWILGNHRLICGDATDPSTVAKVLNGVLPHLLTTSQSGSWHSSPRPSARRFPGAKRRRWQWLRRAV
ncbi:MAG: ParB/Srx family N-terminal domain-containing protein [Tabrizicola sp.]|nr:ParB/Srx family N-terminal domain-containing protein [Tabrizicola sp.]